MDFTMGMPVIIAAVVVVVVIVDGDAVFVVARADSRNLWR